mgnify:CR=1 FL=1
MKHSVAKNYGKALELVRTKVVLKLPSGRTQVIWKIIHSESKHSKLFRDIISGLTELDQFEPLFYSFVRFLLVEQKMATLTHSNISGLTNS